MPTRFATSTAARAGILGPVVEIRSRRALVASGGDAAVFFDRPLTVGLLSAALLALVLPVALSIGEGD